VPKPRTRPQKITFAEMREHGPWGILLWKPLRSVPGDGRAAEAKIDAGANDVGGDAHSLRNAWHYVEVLGLSEINVQVLELYHPVRCKGGFYACASRPACAELAARCGS